jgi:hypothetical protein
MTVSALHETGDLESESSSELNVESSEIHISRSTFISKETLRSGSKKFSEVLSYSGDTVCTMSTVEGSESSSTTKSSASSSASSVISIKSPSGIPTSKDDVTKEMQEGEDLLETGETEVGVRTEDASPEEMVETEEVAETEEVVNSEEVLESEEAKDQDPES